MKTNKILTLALIGDSPLARTYARTILKYEKSFNLKYICQLNQTADELMDSKWYEKYSITLKPINDIMHDPKIDAVILATQLNSQDQIIKLACQYKKAIFCLPSTNRTLKQLYQTKCMVEHAKIPFYLALNTKLHSAHQTLIDSLDSNTPSLIRISHRINSYSNYWCQNNLYDLDLIQWLGNSQIKEIYARQTPKNLFIQLTLENLCLCNIELTLTDKLNLNSNPFIEIHANDTMHPLESITPHMAFDTQTQNKHLEEFVKLINSSMNKEVKQNISLNKKLELIAVQLAAKQSLKENKLIRVKNILASFQCEKTNLKPVNYLTDYNSEETN
jgi:predicted dehydrogenase